MPAHFTKIAAGNPYLIAQTAWENLPPSEKTSITEHEFSSQEWAPLDRRRFRIEPESYRTESLMANVGPLRLSRTAYNRAKETTVRAPGVDGFAISMIERGAGQLILPGADESAIGNATTALIYSVEPGTRLTASAKPSLSSDADYAPPPEARGSAGRAPSRFYRIQADVRSDARRRRYDPPHVRLPVRRAGTLRYTVDRTAPVSTSLNLAYIGQHVFGMPRSY